MNETATISSNDMNMMFDGLRNATQAMQQGFNDTMNAFQNTAQTITGANAPRRTDGYFQQAPPPQQPYGGYGAYVPPQAQPQSYGYGYTERGYAPYGGMYTQPQGGTSTNAAYFGFYNQAYGK